MKNGKRPMENAQLSVVMNANIPENHRGTERLEMPAGFTAE
jgi:hypothetical protein